MSSVTWDSAPRLHRPLVVVAFAGLFDAGQSATWAVNRLKEQIDATRIASIDPEDYFNFQTTRPTVRFDEHHERVITWPENELFVGSSPAGGDHDLALLSGVEPHLRWRSFSEALVEIARTVEADMVVTLGSMVDMVSHRRPVRVKGSSTNQALATRLGLDRPSYEGPTGLVGVLHDALDKAKLPVISLRASVPHYVAGTANPKAAKRLLERFEQVTGVPTGHADMADVVASWERQVDEAASDDADIQAYVRNVEARMDQEEELPSGDDLAAELEEFLRDHRDED